MKQTETTRPTAQELQASIMATLFLERHPKEFDPTDIDDFVEEIFSQWLKEPCPPGFVSLVRSYVEERKDAFA